MNYAEAIDFLLINEGEIKPGLDRITNLIQKLSNPHLGMKIIHVAGTNGKGSVAAFVSCVLTEAGFRVGRFNSPWITEVNECITVNGSKISDLELIQVVDEMLPLSENETSFEKLTTAAFCHFRNSKCEYVVIEAGMGGIQDATNFFEKNLISIITKVSIDHQMYLGETLQKIAVQKAGIIKSNSIVISAPQEQSVQIEISKAASLMNSEMFKLDMKDVNVINMSTSGTVFQFFGYSADITNYEIGLLGRHQVENACVAILALHQIFRRTDVQRNATEIDNLIKMGISKARWPGRFEVIRSHPWVIADGAHNVSGVEALLGTISDLFPKAEPVFIFGIMKDKEIEAMLSLISSVSSKIFVVSPEGERALESSKLAKIASNYFENVHDSGKIGGALKSIMENISRDDLIIICGSLYLLDRINFEVCKHVL